MDIPGDIRTPHKINRLVVAPSYQPGSFDSHAVDVPFLFRHNGRFYMTYVGWNGIGYQIALASSTDLEHWQKEGLILGCGPKGSTTEYNAALTCILRDNDLFGPATLKQVDGKFVGTYHAYPEPGYEAGPAAIGLCFSRDLKKWDVGEPVLTPDPDCAWESGGLYKSWLMESDGVYYLFYNAKNKTEWPWVEQTGVAVSRDLVRWERSPLNPLLRIGAPGQFDDIFASDPCIFRHRDQWLMFYFGLCSDGHARESVAVSSDLISWQKSGEILVDVGLPNEIDSLHAHKPGMISKEGRLYHFYCAVAPASAGESGSIAIKESRGITFARS
jgi:predicted GH43/DUF377 family glycosyl hydrolase